MAEPCVYSASNYDLFLTLDRSLFSLAVNNQSHLTDLSLYDYQENQSNNK